MEPFAGAIDRTRTSKKARQIKARVLKTRVRQRPGGGAETEVAHRTHMHVYTAAGRSAGRGGWAVLLANATHEISTGPLIHRNQQPGWFPEV